MEQTLGQPKSSSTLRNTVLLVGMLLVFGLVAVMAVNLHPVKSVDLQSRTAPDFTLPLFAQFKQDNIVLKNLQGQVVVVNFWASWCVECYKEAELLEKAWQNYGGQNVVFIGVDHLDTEKEALAYMQQYGVTYPSGPDIGDKISRAYGITGVPETFFIDKNGVIAHVQIGPIEADALYSLLDKLVAQKPPQGS